MTDSSDVSTLIAQIELARTRRLDPAHPDTEAIRSTSLKALDPTLLRDYLTSCRSRSRRLAALDDTEVLRAAGVIAPSGEVTLAGIYAMGKNPQRYRPSLGITAAVLMPVGAKERTRDLIHVTGPIPDLLDGAMPWIARNTPTSIRCDDLGDSRETPVLPMWAVRELLVNALVHRNLDAATEAERIELRVVGSTLVITSPGGLRGITEDALGRPDSKCAVNPVLYEICKNLHTTDGARLITDESGIREVRDAAARADLPDPILRDSGVRFTAILRWPATETAEKAAPEEKKAAPEAAEEEKEAAEEAPAPRRSPGTPPAGVPRRTAPPTPASGIQRRTAPPTPTSGIRQRSGSADLERQAPAGTPPSGVPRRTPPSGVPRRIAPPTPASGVQRRGRSKQPRPIFPGSPASTQRRPVSTSPRQASPKTLTDAQRRLLPDLPQPAPANVPADKRAADAAEPEGLAALSRNAPAVWAALSTSHSMSALKRATGLSVQQLRRALQHLIGAGFVEMVGGQGHKETTYRRRPVEGRTD